MKRGDRVKLSGEKQFAWTVQVAGDRYAILTRQAPFKPKGQLWYTILDKTTGWRGPCNLVGNGWDLETKGPYIGSRLLHKALLDGEVEISRRQRIRFEESTLEVKP